MIKFDIKHNIHEVERKLGALEAGVRQRATVSAANKTVNHGRTLMTRQIAAEFNVKQEYVRQRLRIKPASVRQGRFGISATLIGGKAGAKRSANIIAFVERKTTLAAARRRKKAGTLDRIFVKVLRKGAAKPLPEGAFIGNKGRTVFIREGKGRLPIKPVQTIDVGQMFNTKRVNRPVRERIEKRFAALLLHEARFYLDRFNNKGL